MSNVDPSPNRGRIKVLSDAVARRIAAGEVIDRPNAVVRELLDNSLDAGATQIDLRTAGGGNERVAVTDDGVGMDAEDLAKCHLSHATSKISSDRDLDQVRTMGFRGEALSAVAHVAKLDIRSRPADGDGHRLIVHAGSVIALEPRACAAGTTVTVDDLFYQLPARKRFLKRAQSESAAVRSVMLDKALPFPEVSFRLFAQGEMRLHLPASSALERIALAYPNYLEPARMQELTTEGEGFRIQLFAGDPTDARSDRRALQVFVNRRRVWEYALLQAVEYAYQEYVHGGLHPIAYLFLDIDPQLVDFNIHPAKREVKIRCLSEIHRAVVHLLSGYLRGFDLYSGFSSATEHHQNELVADRPADAPIRSIYPTAHHGSAPTPGASPVVDRRSMAPAEVYDLSRRFSPGSEDQFGYLGQLFGLFLMVRRNETLYLIDQHAAHERLLFDRLCERTDRQSLLVPIVVELDAEQSREAEARREAFKKIGMEIASVGSGTWEVRSVPSAVKLSAEQVHAAVLDFLAKPTDVERELFASIACHAAVKDGDTLDDQRARSIAAGALELANARCPHGRPLWVEITREQLLSLVGRESASAQSESIID